MDIQPYTLIQCPFCGSLTAPRIANSLDMGVLGYTDFYAFTIHCDDEEDGCGATCGYLDTEAEAIAAWNTRADE